MHKHKGERFIFLPGSVIKEGEQTISNFCFFIFFIQEKSVMEIIQDPEGKGAVIFNPGYQGGGFLTGV